MLEVKRLSVFHDILDPEDGEDIEGNGFDQEGFMVDAPLLGSRVIVLREKDTHFDRKMTFRLGIEANLWNYLGQTTLQELVIAPSLSGEQPREKTK